MTSFSVTYMYLQSYRRFSFWCSVYERCQSHLDTRFICFWAAWQLSLKISNPIGNWSNYIVNGTELSESRANIPTKTIICVFSRFHCHDFMENDSTCAHHSQYSYWLWLWNVLLPWFVIFICVRIFFEWKQLI